MYKNRSSLCGIQVKKAVTIGNGEHTAIMARQLFLYARISASAVFASHFFVFNSFRMRKALTATAKATANGAKMASAAAS